MFRVNGKIERLLLFDPLDAKWQWVALSLIPSSAVSRSGAATVLAGLDGPSVLASTSTIELFTFPLFFVTSASTPTPVSAFNAEGCKSGKLRATQLSNFARAFHRAFTSNAHQQERVSFKITVVPVGPTLLASRSA